MFTKDQLPDIEIREKKAALWQAWIATEADTPESDAAEKAYDDFDTPTLATDDTTVIRCAACDAPLWEDDETVDDLTTGEVFLRVAIGLPPRAKQDEGQLLPDAEVA